MVEFRPRSSRGPFLADGDVIDGKNVSVALEFGQLLTDVGKVIEDLDPADLRTVVDELALAFPAESEDLRDLLIDGDKALTLTEDLTPRLIRLLQHAERPLSTLAGEAPNLRKFASSLRLIATELRASTPEIGTLVDQGLVTVRLIDSFLEQNLQRLLTMANTSVGLLNTVNARLPAVRALLRAFPVTMSTVARFVSHGTLQARAFVTGPELCSYDQPRREPWELEAQGMVVNSACPSPDGTLVRGWQNAPKP